MILHFFENIFNNAVFLLFGFIYKYCNIETMEDKYHKDKKNNNKSMNKVKIEFNNKDEFDQVKNNVLQVIENESFLSKYNISTQSILNNQNNKLSILFKRNCIIIYFNHYYISGSAMFILLNQIMNESPPTFLQTNPWIGIIYLPLYIYDLISLKKKEYSKNKKEQGHLLVKKNICSSNKRFYLYWTVLNKVYKSLQMNRPMTVALSVAFDEVPHINNNVGIIIINYDITDSIEIVEQKIKNAYYQAYVSNFLLNCPLPDIYFDNESCHGCHVSLFIIDHINKHYKNEILINSFINNNVSDYVLDRLIIIFNGFFEIFECCIKLNKIDYLINFIKRYKYVINKNKFLEKWYELAVKKLECKLPIVIRVFDESYGVGTYDIYFNNYIENLVNMCAVADRN